MNIKLCFDPGYRKYITSHHCPGRSRAHCFLSLATEYSENNIAALSVSDNISSWYRLKSMLIIASLMPANFLRLLARCCRCFRRYFITNHCRLLFSTSAILGKQQPRSQVIRPRTFTSGFITLIANLDRPGSGYFPDLLR